MSKNLVRVYRCKTCDPKLMHWSTTVLAISGTVRIQWKVCPLYISLQINRLSSKQMKDSCYLSTDMNCSSCIDNPRIPDQLFFNISWVQDLTFKHRQGSTKQINQMILNPFQSNNIPHDKLPIKTQQYDAIGQLLVIRTVKYSAISIIFSCSNFWNLRIRTPIHCLPFRATIKGDSSELLLDAP